MNDSVIEHADALDWLARQESAAGSSQWGRSWPKARADAYQNQRLPERQRPKAM